MANINGFWDPLVALLRHMSDEGFIREGFEVSYLVADRVEDVVPMLQSASTMAPVRPKASPNVSIPIADL
jgi:hypothetical protein